MARTIRVVVAMVVLVPGVTDVRGDPITSTTPNIDTPEITRSGTGEFLFTHRFWVEGEKVLNSPTFTLDAGFLERFSAGLRYATSSDVGTGPNELEALVKAAILRQVEGPLDLTAELAYNTAANSVDGAFVLARRLGRVELLGTLRGFSAGYRSGGATLAGGAGASIELTRYLHVAGDLNRVLAASHSASLPAGWDRLGWSAALTFPIPFTPHAVSLYATNVDTVTLEGASRGSDQVRFGFAFNVPLDSFGRWSTILHPPSEEAAPPATTGAAVAAAGGAAVVDVVIEGYAYHPNNITIRPGDTVRWTNRDQVPHTATEASGTWTSPLLGPGAVYEHRFGDPGRVAYYCTVHPFMKGTVNVAR